MNSTSETVCRSNMDAAYDDRDNASVEKKEPTRTPQQPLSIETKHAKPPSGGKATMSPVLL